LNHLDPPVPHTVREAEPDHLAVGLRQAASLLRGATAVTVACHENPDADTLGGGLALARAIERLGGRAEVVCATMWPSSLDFLPRVAEVRTEPLLAPDAVALVDCASIERAGPAVARWIRSGSAPVVNVDHHLSNDRYGTAVCVDPSAAATSEVVARLVVQLGCRPDPEMATLLLAGILHDTDGLRTPETSTATLRLSADLVDAGADMRLISRELFGRRPVAALRLWGRVADTLETAVDGRVVIGMLTGEMLMATGAVMLDAEDMPELIISARGAEIGLLLREVAPDQTRVSIRTSGSVNASSVALEFGGGGHQRAAGCTIHSDPAGARALLIAACERHLAVADRDARSPDREGPSDGD
jgi:phosphoesterase RecJ-like protein